MSLNLLCSEYLFYLSHTNVSLRFGLLDYKKMVQCLPITSLCLSAGKEISPSILQDPQTSDRNLPLDEIQIWLVRKT